MEDVQSRSTLLGIVNLHMRPIVPGSSGGTRHVLIRPSPEMSMIDDRIDGPKVLRTVYVPSLALSLSPRATHV